MAQKSRTAVKQNADVFTPKQAELIALFKRGGLKRINILQGAVRSGKTWISLVIWAFWVAQMPEWANYIMVAKTLTSLRRNTLDLLVELVGGANFSYNSGRKEARLFGRLIFLEGANDARAESKIRGMTLQGAYVDEITQIDEEFFAMLLSRLSLPNAKLIGSTNPDNPKHWLKDKYIDRAGGGDDKLDLLSVNFTLDDNTTLPEDFKVNIKKEHVGVFYERFVLGLWVGADGLIYSAFSDSHIHRADKLPKMTRHSVGVDYGQSNATVFVLVGEGEDGRCWVLDEYYHSGSERNATKSPAGYARDFVAWAKDCQERFKARIDLIYYDPSALGFRAQLSEMGVTGLRAADNEVLMGIQLISSMFDNDLIRVCAGCTRFIKELYSYAWDSNAANVGQDAPAKKNDHLMDAFRYAVMGRYKYWKSRVGQGQGAEK